MKSLISYHFSQSRRLRKRKAKNLHPISEMERFHILVCCFFCSITVSVIYAFDLFTEQFKSQFHLSAGDLSTISTVGLVFCYFTIPYSLIFENLGPFLIFWICFLAALIGGLCLGLVFDGKIHGNTATISVFYAFLNMASGLIDTAYLSTLIEVFPRNRGPVVCLAKVMTGLGSSVLSCLSSTLFENNISGFIYFLMTLCMVVNVWASFAILLPPYFMNWWRRRGKTEEEIAELESTLVYYEHKAVPYPRLIIGYVVVIGLLIFFTVESPVLAYTKVTRASKLAVGSLTVVFTMCIFTMLLPLKCLGGMNEPTPVNEDIEEGREVLQLQDKLGDPSGWAVADQTQEMPALDDEQMEAPVSAVKESRQDPRYQGTLLDYLRAPDLWLILLLFVCYGCIGILVMYNASTISVAMSGKKRSQELSSLYTAFLGVGSSVGRIIFGLFEAYVQSQDADNRRFVITMIIPIPPFLACIAGILILVLPGGAILFPYILVYLEEGLFAGVNALIFPCLFESNHNSLYSISFLMQCVTTICFNRLLFGLSVDKEHDRLNLPSDTDCNEKVCVRMPIIVGTCLAFVGIFVALAIHIRYARFVRRVRAASLAEQNCSDTQDASNLNEPTNAAALWDMPVQASSDLAASLPEETVSL